MKLALGASCLLTLLLISSTASAQNAQLAPLMREKLQHSQQILAAVVTSDWPALERQTQELVRIAEDPRWGAALKTPEYARHSSTFLSAVQDLLEAAKRRDLEATPLAYVSLTLSCIQCHRYNARARLAR